MEVADNLHKLATELWEKQQQNSENSSQPPSKDNPYTSQTTTKESGKIEESESSPTQTDLEKLEQSVVPEKKDIPADISFKISFSTLSIIYSNIKGR